MQNLSSRVFRRFVVEAIENIQLAFERHDPVAYLGVLLREDSLVNLADAGMPLLPPTWWVC